MASSAGVYVTQQQLASISDIEQTPNATVTPLVPIQTIEPIIPSEDNNTSININNNGPPVQTPRPSTTPYETNCTISYVETSRLFDGNFTRVKINVEINYNSSKLEMWTFYYQQFYLVENGNRLNHIYVGMNSPSYLIDIVTRTFGVEFKIDGDYRSNNYILAYEGGFPVPNVNWVKQNLAT